jgi:hypothetical protein
MVSKNYDRKCRTCNHPERGRIEVSCARGVSFEVIATQFGLKKDTVYRHWKKHVTDKTKATLIGGRAKLAALVERANAENMSSLEYFAIDRSQLMDGFLACADAADVWGMTSLGARLFETLREIGKRTGEIQRISGVTINNDNRSIILQSPVIAEIEAALITTLAPYPAARIAVIAALRKIEGGNAVAAGAPQIVGAGVADAA